MGADFSEFLTGNIVASQSERVQRLMHEARALGILVVIVCHHSSLLCVCVCARARAREEGAYSGTGCISILCVCVCVCAPARGRSIFRHRLYFDRVCVCVRALERENGIQVLVVVLSSADECMCSHT